MGVSETSEGAVRVIDFMPRRGAGPPRLMRIPRERFTLTWHLSYVDTPPVEDADSGLARTEAWWRERSGRCAYRGPYRDQVVSSLIALKAMTSETTGAVIAAPTRSLPEDIGGVRNRDYRYCWLRDSVLALQALLLEAPVDRWRQVRDERVTSTIDAISRELGRDGFVSRYSTAETDDGLRGDEGQFLIVAARAISAAAADADQKAA